LAFLSFVALEEQSQLKNSGTALEEQSQNDPAEPPETLRAMGLKKGSDRPLPQCNDPAPTFESKDK